MVESNVELARRGYEAAARGDLDALSEILDSGVQWHGGDPSAPGACHGREQAIQFIRHQARRGRGVGELVEVVDAGEQVVVITRPLLAEGALSASVTTFRDGKAVEMVSYPSPQDALAAVGLKQTS